MRESSRLEKTNLPGDTFEAWLKTQKRQPGGGGGRGKYAPDSYDAWIDKRVEMKKRGTKPLPKRVKR